MTTDHDPQAFLAAATYSPEGQAAFDVAGATYVPEATALRAVEAAYQAGINEAASRLVHRFIDTRPSTRALATPRP